MFQILFKLMENNDHNDHFEQTYITQMPAFFYACQWLTIGDVKFFFFNWTCQKPIQSKTKGFISFDQLSLNQKSTCFNLYADFNFLRQLVPYIYVLIHFSFVYYFAN